jgi:glycosyltransferase involved in cell wall biosynthesis
MTKLRALGVLLCYNDGDFLVEAIEHLLAQNHDLFVVDHGSTDETAAVLDTYKKHFVERFFLPRTFDFYNLYPWVSRKLLACYVSRYDWISWPDQDELLEGPNRRQSYWEWVQEAYQSPYQWLQFRNFNFWCTSADDPKITKAAQRVRHYGIFPDCMPRIRAWKARATNIRVFNHNPPVGERYPEYFNLRHYPMRSIMQMRRRLDNDRASLERNGMNYHYAHMQQARQALEIAPSQLYCDNGNSDLNLRMIFNWRTVYGHASGARPTQMNAT